MSKNSCSVLAGFMLFCVSHHRMFACPICIDSSGNIKKPSFHNKAEKQNAKDVSKKQK